MKLWIARDFNERLYLYEKKPELNPCNNEFYCIYGEKFYQLDIELFPEITFENSPKEVELKLVEN